MAAGVVNGYQILNRGSSIALFCIVRTEWKGSIALFCLLNGQSEGPDKFAFIINKGNLSSLVSSQNSFLSKLVQIPEKTYEKLSGVTPLFLLDGNNVHERQERSPRNSHSEITAFVPFQQSLAQKC